MWPLHTWARAAWTERGVSFAVPPIPPAPPDLSLPAVAEALFDVCGGRAVSSERLSGGYSWITLKVGLADASSVILRVAPLGGTVEPYNPAAEALRVSAAAGVVRVPDVLGVCPLPNPIGRPFGVYSFLEGEVVRRPPHPDPYRRRLAETLGALHGGAAASEVDKIEEITAAYEAELARMAANYRRCWRHPGIDAAFRWLHGHIPDCPLPPVLCHGDFRPANVLWNTSGELAGVIDWERAWVGDPLCDIAFSMHFGGWAAIEGQAFDVYTSAGGAGMDAGRLSYALRLERVRSYLSAMTGLSALVRGYSDDRRLALIGASAQEGAWELVRWLESDLPSLSAVVGEPPAAWCPLHEGFGFGISSAPADAADAAANPPEEPNVHPPSPAWRAEWERLVARIDDCGHELAAPLLELGSKDPAARKGLPAMHWRE